MRSIGRGIQPPNNTLQATATGPVSIWAGGDLSLRHSGCECTRRAVACERGWRRAYPVAAPELYPLCVFFFERAKTASLNNFMALEWYAKFF